MSLPVLSPEQRTAALVKAAQVRFTRAKVKKLLKQGAVPLAGILQDAATDDAIARMKVLDLVQAMPGVGKVRAKQIMTRLGIADTRRVRGLGPNQRDALEREFPVAA